MMRSYLKLFNKAILILLFGFSYANSGSAQQYKNNPAPDPHDLLLPMPDGKVMAFREVCIGQGSDSYSWKRFRLGDASGGFRESPTGVAIGGAFLTQEPTGEHWCYYIGKYEVTEDQLELVLKENPSNIGSIYPANDITWFKAQAFIHKYNVWLYANSPQMVPTYGGIPGYIRLPTEIEWEFAVRGGSKVSSVEFDRKIPYQIKDLSKHEWFAGPKSSHNKIKKIGMLKPNPIGIHDMLGNVSEMTRSLYQIEYYQGRSGGFVAKGGHFLTGAKSLRSSLRTEQGFYQLDEKSKKMFPKKQQTLGFRLLLSSLVFPNQRISKQLKDDWNLYQQGNAKSLPASISTSATSNQTQILNLEANSQLDRLTQELERSGVLSNTIEQEIKLLSVMLNDIQFTILKAEKDSAYAWIKISGEQAFFIYKEARKLPVLKKLKDMAKEAYRKEALKKYQEREKEIQNNIQGSMIAYTESVRQLGTSSSSAIEDGFSRYADFLKKNHSQLQLVMLKVVRGHIESYIKEKRINHDSWKSELLEWEANSE